MNNNRGETKWKRGAFRKKRSNIVSDDYEVQLMNDKIRNAKKRTTNYKNIPELTNVYEMPLVEGFLDNPDLNNNITSVSDCLKNGDPSKCDYEGIIYPDKSTATTSNQILNSGINNFFQNFESINMKIAKYTYTTFSGAENIIKSGYNYKMDRFLEDIAYYNIELAASDDVAEPNPLKNPLITEFYSRKDKNQQYDDFVRMRLEEDIKQAVDGKNQTGAFSLKYIPRELRNSDNPKEELELAKYIHDILLIKDYFGLFEAEILCVWCLYNLYFFIYKGDYLPQISRMWLFEKAQDNHYFSVLEFFFSTTLVFPEILTNIKEKVKKLAEYKERVLSDNFKILTNIIGNKACIMIVLFAFLLWFLATIGKFMKRFLLKIVNFDGIDPKDPIGVSVGLCFVIALLAYFYYIRDLIHDGRVGTLKVIGYFAGYAESVEKLGVIGVILLLMLMILHFIVNMMIAVPLGMTITVIYFLFCMFAGILYVSSLVGISIIDNEVDSNLAFEINRATEKCRESGNSIWSSIYYTILIIIKFIYNLKHFIALIVICSIILNDIQLHASNVKVCNYIFIPILVIAIIAFCYKAATFYSKKIDTLINSVSGVAENLTSASKAESSVGSMASLASSPLNPMGSVGKIVATKGK
jgi:hypothetical protein